MPKRALIVDDEENIREMIRLAFKGIKREVLQSVRRKEVGE
ncbi:MAG TPA: hypothetical protein VI306_02065 [Pyrinomonadaceae bacterium]